MKKLLLLFALFTGFTAVAQVNHTDQKGLKQGKWVKTYESGKKRYEGYFKNNIPVGTFTYYFEREGGIMSEIVYRGETGSGFAKAYHTNGIMQAEGLYKNQIARQYLALLRQAGHTHAKRRLCCRCFTRSASDLLREW